LSLQRQILLRRQKRAILLPSTALQHKKPELRHSLIVIGSTKNININEGVSE
jgi:hypothetical protein